SEMNPGIELRSFLSRIGEYFDADNFRCCSALVQTPAHSSGTTAKVQDTIRTRPDQRSKGRPVSVIVDIGLGGMDPVNHRSILWRNLVLSAGATGEDAFLRHGTHPGEKAISQVE